MSITFIALISASSGYLKTCIKFPTLSSSAFHFVFALFVPIFAGVVICSGVLPIIHAFGVWLADGGGVEVLHG
jgi:hypothetical protein